MSKKRSAAQLLNKVYREHRNRYLKSRNNNMSTELRNQNLIRRAVDNVMDGSPHPIMINSATREGLNTLRSNLDYIQNNSATTVGIDATTGQPVSIRYNAVSGDAYYTPTVTATNTDLPATTRNESSYGTDGIFRYAVDLRQAIEDNSLRDLTQDVTIPGLQLNTPIVFNTGTASIRSTGFSYQIPNYLTITQLEFYTIGGQIYLTGFMKLTDRENPIAELSSIFYVFHYKPRADKVSLTNLEVKPLEKTLTTEFMIEVESNEQNLALIKDWLSRYYLATDIPQLINRQEYSESNKRAIKP